MKNRKFLNTFIFLGLLFSFPVLAEQVCSWETPREEITTIPGYMGQPIMQTIKVCPDPMTSGNSCSGKNTEDKLCCCNEITPAASNKPKFVIPDFQIKIPGMEKLSEVKCENGECKIFWIAEYTAGIYKYGLTVVGIIAVLFLMAAGLLWIVSGGDSNKISQAKKMILGSITGLFLMVGLNMILTFINPDLTKPKAITLTYIEPINIETDADIEQVGGVLLSSYYDACKLSKKGDWSACESLGNKEPANMTTLEGKKIDQAVAQKYLAAMECVKNKNGKQLFYLGGGFRSAANQIKVKKDKIAEGKSNEAAAPCCSNHGSGQAMDIKRLDGAKMSWDYNKKSGLEACMNAQGLYAKLTSSPNEPWHWSPTGK